MGGTGRWRALAVALLLAVPAGCGGGDGGSGSDPGDAASTSPVTSDTGATGAVDVTESPEASESTGSSGTTDPADWPTVEPPGPREDPLVPADVLVFSPERPLDEDMVRRIGRLKGVQEAALFSMGQPVIENRALTVAAVDPASYRVFTPQATADTEEVWERVAAGEMALSQELQKKLPISKDGYLRLGSSEDAEQVHIGAFAPQVESAIDAVVNDAWVDRLGLQAGNALLVSTGQTAPQALRKPLKRIVGDQASIQALDVVAREGLDPKAKQTALVVGSAADAVGVFNYTVLGGGRIAPDPAWVRSRIETRVMPIIGSMTCNKAIFPQLEAALREIVESDLADELNPDEYAGCYYPRFIAGSTTLSNHSFGLAMDFNVPGNLRGTAGEMHRGIVAIFKKWGFAWGGDWRYTDPMHFEMSRLVSPR